MPDISTLLRELTPLRAALILLLAAIATISGAWIFQWAGYLPCELCLKQRWIYYAAIPLAVLVTGLAWSGPPRLASAGLLLLALVFVGSSVFGVYHAGVEWGFWPGPADCTGTFEKAPSMEDFMKQLQTIKVVRCDAVAIRILGLSLAGWNAIISAGLVACAYLGATAGRRASV